MRACPKTHYVHNNGYTHIRSELHAGRLHHLAFLHRHFFKITRPSSSQYPGPLCTAAIDCLLGATIQSRSSPPSCWLWLSPFYDEACHPDPHLSLRAPPSRRLPPAARRPCAAQIDVAPFAQHTSVALMECLAGGASWHHASSPVVRPRRTIMSG